MIFSPSIIESDRLLAWTQSWEMPFKVCNFVYLTSPDIKYYLVYSNEATDADVVSYLVSTLPEGLNIQAGPANEVSSIPEEDNQIRLIFLNVPAQLPTNLQSMQNTQVSALVLNADTIEDLSKNTMEFYVKKGPSFGSAEGIYPAFGMPAVFGAIYTGDYELYECIMRKALLRMTLVAEVYDQRAIALQNYFNTIGECRGIYSPIFGGFKYDGGSVDSFQSSVFSSMAIVQEENHNAILASCSTLY